jgi:hypothetical protein
MEETNADRAEINGLLDRYYSGAEIREDEVNEQP